MAPLAGPVGVGAFVDAIMLGCVIVQSCMYYKNFRGDAWLLRFLVLLVLFLLLSHLGCMGAWLWETHKMNAGDEPMPIYATILFGVSGVCGAVILFLERCFFSYRIMKASRNHLLAFLFFLLCIFTFTPALGAASLFFTNPTADLTSQLSHSWIFPLVVISGLACDLAINIATAVYLRSQTQVADALGHVSRLLCWAAETSIVTSLFGLAAVIVYCVAKTNLAWLGLYIFMPGVFANAFLVALNARGHLCADIQHQRVFKIGEQLIDKRAKKPPVRIVISKQTEKQSEKSPV
ncbi:hypothetical protein L210DRAFT_3560573 [Boletus edulis BED1]|uniref:DUF6534 domain-containing protein n=1 Tax=Boletus edulis BED1 TaxID=1328754 RepID=A0AAD4BIF9_BOLED|nr:hypothetical protein L210DRAFT_3569530 [Boletus edulis BED1]KAF8431489.1 hypothetical protein L210DRAFT_3560573 [Boletus edulis BED1]